jgi:hypothetical protein
MTERNCFLMPFSNPIAKLLVFIGVMDHTARLFQTAAESMENIKRVCVFS